MDSSFQTWRNSQRESSHGYISDEDSDNIVCSNSEERIVILASDSDDEDDVSFQKDESQNSAISVKTEKKMSSISCMAPKTSINSVSSSKNISSDSSNVQKTFFKSEGSSKNTSLKNSGLQSSSLKSDNISTYVSSEDSSLGQQSLLKENTSSSNLELQIKSKVRKNRILDSDSSSDFIDEDFEHSLNQSPFHDENICSSTRLVDSDNTSLVKSNSKQYSKHNSIEEKKFNLTETSLERKTKIPTFDLTLGESDNAYNTKQKHKNLPISITNVRNASNEKVIIVESDSEEDKSKHKFNVQDEAANIQVDLTGHFSSIKISPDGQKPKFSTLTSSLPSNDLSSRIESLKAEESRLGMEVSGVLKNIEATKVITIICIIVS